MMNRKTIPANYTCPYGSKKAGTRRTSTILLATLILATFATNGCTRPEEDYAEQRVDHKAVMRIRVGTKKERMFAILKIPAYEEGVSGIPAKVFGKPLSHRESSLPKPYWYRWHYDAEQDLVCETWDGEIDYITYSKRSDLSPKQENLLTSLVNRLLMGM